MQDPLPARQVAERFGLRHRSKVLNALVRSGWLLLFGILVLVFTVVPTLLLWWDSAVPAAIGTAIVALIVFTLIVMLPLEFIPYLGLYFDRPLEGVPFPGFRFGCALYRQSGRLDAQARAAGLPPLSDFESPDVLDTGQPPLWYGPQAALPTVEHLLAQAQAPALRRDLQHVQRALRAAIAEGASFYVMVLTLSGVTNAEIEARRRAHAPAAGSGEPDCALPNRPPA
jgi:hypothetical protein